MENAKLNRKKHGSASDEMSEKIVLILELNHARIERGSSYSYEDRLSGLDVDATQEKLRYLLESRGLKDKEISKALGITPQAVNKWRHKECFLDIENLFILSGLLRVNIDEILVPRKREHREHVKDEADASKQ